MSDEAPKRVRVRMALECDYCRKHFVVLSNPGALEAACKMLKTEVEKHARECIAGAEARTWTHTPNAL